MGRKAQRELERQRSRAYEDMMPRGRDQVREKETPSTGRGFACRTDPGRAPRTHQSKETVREVAQQLQGQQLQTVTPVALMEQREKELECQRKELRMEMEVEVALLPAQLAGERRAAGREEEQLKELLEQQLDTGQGGREQREQEQGELSQKRNHIENLHRHLQEAQEQLQSQRENHHLRQVMQEIRDELDEAQRAYEDVEFLLLEQECRQWPAHEDGLGTLMLEPNAQELQASGAEHCDQWQLRKEQDRVEDLHQLLREAQEQLRSQPENHQLRQVVQEIREELDEAQRAYEDLQFLLLEQECEQEQEDEDGLGTHMLEPNAWELEASGPEHWIQGLEGNLNLQEDDVAAQSLALGREMEEAPQEKTQIREEPDEAQHLYEDRAFLHLEQVCQWEEEEEQDSPGALVLASKVKELQANVAEYRCWIHSLRQQVNWLWEELAAESWKKEEAPQALTQGSIGLQSPARLSWERGERLSLRRSPRPLPLHGSGSLEAATPPPAEGDSTRHPNYQLLTNGSKNGDGALPPDTADLERLLKQAVVERDRLLRAREETRRNTEASSGSTVPATQAPPISTPPACPPGPLVLDLQQHLECWGHSPANCPHVQVSGACCRGFLVKMGCRGFKVWRKRWFCFDRQARRLAYYSDKEESKLKCSIDFQDIEEVYFDHLRCAFKSPNRCLTFCVKTYERLFYLVAPSHEAMGIWIDVIVTAADENRVT